jgi:hypothetical protein
MADGGKDRPLKLAFVGFGQTDSDQTFSTPSSMKLNLWLCSLTAIAVAGIAGCSSTPKSAVAPGPEGVVYRKSDRLQKVFVAEGFDFAGYDTLLVLPTLVDPSVKPKDDKERERLELLQRSLPAQFAALLASRSVVPHVVNSRDGLQPGSRVLELQLSVLQFSRGSSTERWVVGFGAGMPYVYLRGKISPLGESTPLLMFEEDERGDWLGTGFESNRDIQAAAGLELADDAVSFMSDLAQHRPIKFK